MMPEQSAESALHEWVYGFGGDPNTLVLPMEVFVRQSSPDTMLLGVIRTDGPILRSPYADEGVFLLGSMSLHVDTVYRAGDSCKGLRADRILVRGFDPKRLQSVSPADVFTPPSPGG